MPPPPARPSVLHIGAGTSALSLALYEHLIAKPSAQSTSTTLIHTDFSEVAVKELTVKLQGRLSPRHQVLNADVRSMSAIWPSPQFDVVVDKGVIDVFVHSRSDVSVEHALQNVHRVLRPSGCYVMITNDDADAREAILEKCGRGMFELETMTTSLLVGEGEDDGFVTNLITIKKKR